MHGLGGVLYALLTGRAPFGGDSVVDTLAQVKEQPPEPPRKLNPKVPRDLETICLKCLEKDPRRRYPSAQALADDVRAWLEDRPIAGRPVGALERAAMFVRRRPAVAAAYGLLAAVVLLFGFGGSLAWLWRAAERARADAERQREKFERLEYGRTVQMAHQQWRENDITAALGLLEGTRPDLRGWEWRYVERLCHSDSLTINSHYSKSSIYASFSPDGTRIVTTIGGHTAKVWDAATGAEVLTLKGLRGFVGSASFSPDGTRIVTASWDQTAKVWDAADGGRGPHTQGAQFVH